MEFRKNLPLKSYGVKKQYANELELAVSRFRAVSGPMERSSYVKVNWWVECSLGFLYKRLGVYRSLYE